MSNVPLPRRPIDFVFMRSVFFRMQVSRFQCRSILSLDRNSLSMSSLRRGAALAIVGWYLLLPPFRANGPTSDPNTQLEANTLAPFSEWSTIAEFNTEKECQAYPDHFLKLLNSDGSTTEEKRGASSAA